MKIGYFCNSTNWGNKKSYNQILEEIRDIATYCDQNDWDSIWFSEHHFSHEGMEICPNPILLSSDIAARTKNIRIGQAASMGSLLLTAGEPGMRYSLPNSRIMVHQPSGGYQGQATDIMIHAEETLKLKKRLNEIYVKHTGQSLKTVEAALERDNFMAAEDAKKWGLIDEIVTQRTSSDEE